MPRKNPEGNYIKDFLEYYSQFIENWSGFGISDISVEETLHTGEVALRFSCVYPTQKWKLVGVQDDNDDTQYTLYKWRATDYLPHWVPVGSWSSRHIFKEMMLKRIKSTPRSRREMEVYKFKELTIDLADYVPCLSRWKREVSSSRKDYLSRAPEASIGAGIVIAGLAGYFLGKK